MSDDNVKPFKRPERPAPARDWLDDARDAFADAGVNPEDCFRTDDGTDWIKPVDNVKEIVRKPDGRDEDK